MENIILLVMLAIVGTCAIRQEIMFYTEPEFEGDAVFFRSHKPNFTAYELITRNSQSVCVTGFWYVFLSENYENMYNNFGSQSGSLSCFSTTTLQTGNSIRYLGGSDTTKPGISFYSGSNFEGQEFHVEHVANLPFQPKSYATTGRSSWTIFTDINFGGNSSCISSSGSSDIQIHPQFQGVVRSVSQGCINVVTLHQQ